MEQRWQKERLYGLAVILVPGIAAFIAVLSPRFLAFWPGVAGFILLAAYPFVFDRQALRAAVPRPILLWLLGITALAGASSFWAIDPAFAVERTAKMALVLFGGFLFYIVARAVPAQMVLPHIRVLGVCLLTATGLVLIELLAGFPLYKLMKDIADAQAVNHSVMNRSMVALLCLAFPFLGLLFWPQDRRMIISVFLLVGGLALVTHSQSAQIGVILGLICFFAFPYSRAAAWRIVTILLIAGTVLAPFLAAFLFQTVSESVNTMPFLGHGSGYGGQRLEIWDAVGRYALQSPLWGHGIEAARAVGAFEMQGLYRKSPTVLHPHNFAIQLWIEFGLLGVAVCAALFWQLLGGLSRCQYAAARIGLPAFAVILSAASFGYGLWQSWFLGLMILTFAFAKLAMRLYEEKRLVSTEIKEDSHG